MRSGAHATKAQLMRVPGVSPERQKRETNPTPPGLEHPLSARAYQPSPASGTRTALCTYPYSTAAEIVSPALACAAWGAPTARREPTALLKFLVWCLLLLCCWPLALLALVLYPIVWVLLLPFRIVGIAVDGVLRLVGALILFPARLLRAG